MSAANLSNALQFGYESIEDAFPVVDSETEPMLSNYMVQIRRVKKRTKGGIYVPPNAQMTEASITQVGKVVALGPVAFKNRETLKPWPEGGLKVGDFVRIPRYSGYRFSVNWEDTSSPRGKDGKHEVDEIAFAIFEDITCIARITGDPRKVISYT